MVNEIAKKRNQLIKRFPWTFRFIALFVILLFVGYVYENIARAKDKTEYPPMGELVDIGEYRLHLYCVGEGSPTVVFESGLGNGALDWVFVQEEIAQKTRTCSYDRAGIGWSDSTDDMVSVAQVSDNLHTLLINAQEAPPYVLVGHSMGSIYIREFTHQYPDEVVGLVLVDSSHEQQTFRLQAVSGEADSSNPLQTILAFCQLTAPFGIPRLLKMPEGFLATFPYEESIKAQMVATMYRPSFCAAMGREFEVTLAATDQNISLRSLGDRPLIVLSNHIVASELEPEDIPPDMTLAEIEASSKVVAELQQELADLSSVGEMIPVRNGSHYIHLDKPDLVIESVERVMIAAQSGGGK